MSFTRYASFDAAEILDVKGTREKQRTASLDKLSDYSDFRTHDGYLYARIRAISSRVNKNHDGWPAIELAGSSDIFDQHTSSEGFTVEASKDRKYGFSTFLGKPIFVDHNNSDPQRARGVIVDAKFHVEDAKTASADAYYSSAGVDQDHLPASWVELLLEVDAEKFPRLASAIVSGSEDGNTGIDGFSMGCDVDYTLCNICSNKATAPDEFCDHVRMKGATFDYHDSKTGSRTAKKSYENCYGIKFFEISAVFDPADETALLRELIQKEAGEKLADHPKPQSENITAPEEVDTLRKERVCPVCGSDVDAEKCDVCGHVEPPDGLNTPDLAKHQELQEEENLMAEPEMPGEGNPQGDVASPLDASNAVPPAGVTSRVFTPRIHPKLAGRINDVERPIQPGAAPATDEPQEKVIKDESIPVTSHTAAGLIEAAGQHTTQENSMADSRVAAEPADPSGKPDKRIPVDGVGGFMDANAEASSAPDKRIDPEGKGGFMDADNASASAPDEHQSVEETSENAGFDEGGNKNNNSGPTKTFPNNGTGAVTDKAFPTAAATGTKPNGGADVQPQRRENLEQGAPSVQTQNGTEQWSGTNGNGVTRQQDPVTKVVDPNITVSGLTSHIVNVMKLADAEIDLGIIAKEAKYARIAELETENEATIAARLDTYSRVRTAGLKRQVTVSRMPSFRTAGTSTPEPTDEKLEDPRYGDAIFGL